MTLSVVSSSATQGQPSVQNHRERLTLCRTACARPRLRCTSTDAHFSPAAENLCSPHMYRNTIDRNRLRRKAGERKKEGASFRARVNFPPRRSRRLTLEECVSHKLKQTRSPNTDPLGDNTGETNRTATELRNQSVSFFVFIFVTWLKV